MQKLNTIDTQIGYSLKTQLISLKPMCKQGALLVRFIGTMQGQAVYSTVDKKYRYVLTNGALKAI